MYTNEEIEHLIDAAIRRDNQEFQEELSELGAFLTSHT